MPTIYRVIGGYNDGSVYWTRADAETAATEQAPYRTDDTEPVTGEVVEEEDA